ncbi:hypothetical protein [Glaciecola petra]|uniref:Lipoprotein n=1 Tax=Glaciecola petra TaxID=3075602 RepID=A0ABU2ZNV4_9ALTE|nr:hypothetical protein [Aestuariibacter sp. P117]MDT0594302.1 hypothetical protein [Aestuariibacter sp. P117]
MNSKSWLLIIVVCALYACGGGSGSDQSTPDNPGLNPIGDTPSVGDLTPILDTGNILIYGQQQAEVGEALGFAVVPQSGNAISSIRWSQTSGPLLNILASNSQTIGFDTKETGNYSLTLSLVNNGEEQTHNIDFVVSNMSESLSTIRLDHTVTELGKVSLHMDIPETKTLDNIQWNQIAGPQAQNIQNNDDFLFFDAPAVDNDEIISFEGIVQFTDGSSESDRVLVTVKNVDFDTNGLFFSNNIVITEDLFAYKSNSPYKNPLESCVYSNNIPGTPNCTFRDLPLIGTSSNSPSIDDVMNRTLVSHAWMGERFEQYLTNSAAGPDMLQLLRGVTAIVISYDVRPSFYWSATGAIYLDARNFWQSPEERDTLNDVPDFRSDFGSDLQFAVLWRYTKNNQYYPAGGYSKQNRDIRPFEDLEASISWLMYHELAHANDFFPPTSWPNMNPNTTPLAYFRNNGTSSDILTNTYPLRSDEMHALARVRFQNETPNSTQIAYRGSDVAGFFTPDIAPSFYAYLTNREDFATLVERFMMLHRLDAEADVAIIDGAIDNSNPSVTWGQRNRVSSPALEDRTVFAVSRVYPELGNVRNIVQTLPLPILMRENEGWLDNLDISPTFENESIEETRSPLKLSELEKRAIIERDRRDIHSGRPNLKP